MISVRFAKDDMTKSVPIGSRSLSVGRREHEAHLVLLAVPYQQGQ